MQNSLRVILLIKKIIVVTLVIAIQPVLLLISTNIKEFIADAVIREIFKESYSCNLVKPNENHSVIKNYLDSSYW